MRANICVQRQSADNALDSVYEKVDCPAVYIHDMEANSGDKSINERENDGVMEIQKEKGLRVL